MKVRKRLFGIFVVTVSLIALIVNHRQGVDGDFRVAVINDQGIFLRSVSNSRKMVNVMDVQGETMVWIPEGLGWYRAETIRKILAQEKKLNLIDKMLFYNFGFVPHVVLSGSEENWLWNVSVIRRWGIANYIGFLLKEESLMAKQEKVESELLDYTDYFNEVLPRDFADSEILKEDLKISVYNQSSRSGLAAFAARNLEWSGMAIVGVENYGGEIGKCQVAHGGKVDNYKGFIIIRKIFGDCEFVESEDIAENEVEVTLGDEFDQMLNYGSYSVN